MPKPLERMAWGAAPDHAATRRQVPNHRGEPVRPLRTTRRQDPPIPTTRCEPANQMPDEK
ncbi:MAG: hypothetical protein Q7U53_17255 [Anaerolineaceae bacterium]|nr:hypothetical protein [Anaerolineaceae bacterium]